MKTNENTQQPQECPQGQPNPRCAECTHKCPMADAITSAPVPWWVWAMCAAGVILIGLGVKFVAGLF